MLARRRGDAGVTSVLIDTSPDLREQVLAQSVSDIDAVLYTHDHADQTHGIDDLRAFVMRRRARIPAWMDAATEAALRHRFAYIFDTAEGYPALLDARRIPEHGQAWTIDGSGGSIPVVTFDQEHGPIRSVGYRLGDVSYSSDVSNLDEAGLAAVHGSRLWIVDALRWTPHPTHAHVDRALEWIAGADVQCAVLTNLHVDLDYITLSRAVPANVEVAYDGWTATIPL